MPAEGVDTTPDLASARLRLGCFKVSAPGQRFGHRVAAVQGTRSPTSS